MFKLNFEVIILLEFSFSFLVLSFNDLNERSANINDCVVNIDNVEVNLNKLFNNEGYEFVSGNNTYVLNICGSALKCKHPDASACIINEKKEIKIIGLFNRKLNFHHKKLRYKYGKQVEALIEFNCNRYFKIPYIQFDTQLGKAYKFIFHTSLICVKLPMMCTTYDAENNVQYDISSLNNPKNNLIVRNFTHGVTAYFNLCGKLHLIKSKNNECGYEGTQICAVDETGKATNLGVFSTELKVNNNGISVNFTGGSLCSNISTIVTKIDFICSFNDTGPILTYSSDCEYNIVWYSPSACPYYSSISEDCDLDNLIYGRQNMAQGDKEIQLSSNVKMKYNICGELSCNGHNNISFCLLKNKEEIIFGVSNKTLISKDASVYMNLTGEFCDSKNQNHSVNIEFRCDYTQNKLDEISISKDLCTAYVTVYTTKVCKQPDVLNMSCKVPENETHYYDLTPLMLKDHNYEITDPEDSDKVYLLNVCLPVVSGSNAICDIGSGVCLRNNAEPIKYKRFKSIGSYISGLKMENNKLIFQYESGVLCPGSEPHYKAVIEFKCVHQSQISKIKLLKTDCLYTFVWETPYACPIAQNNTNTSDSKIMLNDEDIGKFANPEVAIIYKTEETAITTDTIPETTILRIKKHELESTTKKIINEAITISMYVPVEGPSSSGIFLKNCTLKDHELSQYNMYSLPRVTHVVSKTGKLYSVNICHQQPQMCTSMRCLSNMRISLDHQFVIVNFTEQKTCKSNPYNSMIIMKCSHEFEEPVIIQEQECSVQLEWKNAAACAFLKTESHAKSATGNIIAIVIAAVFLIVGIIIVGGYYIVRKHRINDSTQLLVQYSRVKDSDKIA